VSASAGRVGFEFAWSKQDAHAHLTELVNATDKHGVGSKSLVDEREYDDPGTQPGQLGELGENVVVGDSGGPLIDRVVRRGGHDDRVCLGQAGAVGAR